MSPGRLDARVVRRHLSARRGALRNLRAHQGRSAAELATNADLRWIVERGLQLAAQNVLDVATHVSAARGQDAPDYASAILGLGDGAVLTPAAARSLRDLAGFRNVLVHGYLDVDLQVQVVEEVLGTRLDELEAFADSVQRWLHAQGASTEA
jgi:uncharacterized protein YutE (UPF0331/DUF86 family)